MQSALVLRDVARALTGRVTCGGILGADRGVWAATPGFHPAHDDLHDLPSVFELRPEELNFGLTFQYEPYQVLARSAGTIVARNSYGGRLVLCRCPDCVVLSYTEQPGEFTEYLSATEEAAARMREAIANNAL
jgi:hypothetical protein